jgi:hypothetical protein
MKTYCQIIGYNQFIKLGFIGVLLRVVIVLKSHV